MYLHISKKSRTFAPRKIHYKPFKIISIMKKNIVSFALALIRTPHVINVTTFDNRVTFSATKEELAVCLNLALINDMYISVYSVNKGYYSMAAHLNRSLDSYENVLDNYKH